jgi:hypothetical protein
MRQKAHDKIIRKKKVLLRHDAKNLDFKKK